MTNRCIRTARPGLLAVLAVTLAAPTLAQTPAAPPTAASPPAAGKPTSPPREPWQLTAGDFARLPFVASIKLSPGGTRFAGLMGIQGRQGIAIVNFIDRSEKPVTFGLPEGTEASWIRWVNEDNVLVGLNALLPVEADRWYVSRVISINRLTGKSTKLAWDLVGQNSNVIWVPSDGSNQVLLSAQGSIYLEEAFWPKVMRVDVTNGRKSKVVDGRINVMDWSADSTGQVRTGTGYDDSTRTYRLIYRGESGGMFRIVDRADLRKDESLIEPLLFVPGTDNALVIRANEKGKDALVEIDLRTLATARTVYTAPGDADVRSALVSADDKGVIGVVNSDDLRTVRWLDPALAEMQSALDKAVPGKKVSIVSMSNDRSRFLLTVDRPDTPGAIYYFDVASPKMNLLAAVNEAVGTRPLNPVKAIRYKARDGLEIEAILTLPKHRPARALPIVVMPHGGPWAHDTLTYDYWAQFVASRGYAVIQPNFRGSTGYGADFLEAGEGQMGLKMQDDVSDALHWAVAEGLADPKRACIMGASYGGYAAMWGIAREPDLFRCAISIAGVANLRREVNDFGGALREGQYKDSWKAMTPDFAAVSPIYAVDRIKVPLLLVHGKKDVTVDAVQSESMNSKMRGAGKRVEYLALPEADHYFTRQADREALLGAVEKFLAQHNPPG